MQKVPYFWVLKSGSILRMEADLYPWIQEKKSFFQTYLVKEDIFPIDSFSGVLLKYAWKINSTGQGIRRIFVKNPIGRSI